MVRFWYELHMHHMLVDVNSRAGGLKCYMHLGANLAPSYKNIKIALLF